MNEGSNLKGWSYSPEPLILNCTRKELSNALLRGCGRSESNKLEYFNEESKRFSEFFSNNPFSVDTLLSGFCENILDLSINESSVHWLGHSQLQAGNIYAELSRLFIIRTACFYDEVYKGIFAGFTR